MFSIIVPVFNSESYLDVCVSSILSQEFSDFELILVDDGSTDKSGDRCDEWAKRDDRVFSYHIVNGGANNARLYGLKKSGGGLDTFYRLR